MTREFQKNVVLLERNEEAGFAWEELVDAGVKTAIAPPSGLSERIKSAVHSGKSAVIPDFPWWRRGEIWTRISSVAAVLVICFAGAVVWNNSEAGVGMPEVASVESVVPAAPDYSKYKLEDVYASETAAVVKTRSKKGQHVRAVSTKGLNKGMEAHTQSKHFLPSSVRHVWSVDDVNEALKQLRLVAQVNGRAIVEGETDEPGDGNTKIVLTLTDGELQYLVDKMSSWNWKLLKPELPQPAASERVNFTGQSVDYHICLVVRE